MLSTLRPRFRQNWNLLSLHTLVNNSRGVELPFTKFKRYQHYSRRDFRLIYGRPTAATAITDKCWILYESLSRLDQNFVVEAKYILYSPVIVYGCTHIINNVPESGDFMYSRCCKFNSQKLLVKIVRAQHLKWSKYTRANPRLIKPPLKGCDSGTPAPFAITQN
jgi:hypothetical protein